METLKTLFISDRCLPVYPWFTLPGPEDVNKAYFENDPRDAERQKNWVQCRKQRALEILPLALLIALLILLLAPSALEPYIDYFGYGLAGIAIVGWLTAEYRAKMEYKLYVLERTVSGMNQKEYINYKKKNIPPQFYEII